MASDLEQEHKGLVARDAYACPGCKKPFKKWSLIVCHLSPKSKCMKDLQHTEFIKDTNDVLYPNFQEKCRFELRNAIADTTMPVQMQEPEKDMESEFADMICQKLVECCEDTDPYLQNGACDEVRQKVGQAEYCEICKMWLNGPTQMNDHMIGKKHKQK